MLRIGFATAWLDYYVYWEMSPFVYDVCSFSSAFQLFFESKIGRSASSSWLCILLGHTLVDILRVCKCCFDLFYIIKNLYTFLMNIIIVAKHNLSLVLFVCFIHL